MNEKIELLELNQTLINRQLFNMLKTIKENENEFTNPVANYNYFQFNEWAYQMIDWGNGINLPYGFVQQRIFILYVDHKPVGLGKIRMKLTEASREFGGNLGYAIGFNYRNMGYGSKLLKLLVKKAKILGLEELLLTVEKQNVISKNVIIKCGGVLYKENEQRFFLKFEL